jgi:hypothetical protein
MVNGLMSQLVTQVMKRPLGFCGHDDAFKVDLQHHGVDHHPDEYRDGDGHVGIGKPVQKRRNTRQKTTDQDTRRHAENDPHSEIFFKKPIPALFSFSIRFSYHFLVGINPLPCMLPLCACPRHAPAALAASLSSSR